MKQKKHSRQNKRDFLHIPWTPFVLCPPDPGDLEYAIYRNSRYQVHMKRIRALDGAPDLIHLSFKRLDRQIFIPYRDKMRIKDELVGRECEGVELLPARSREVDAANQYHLWIIDDPCFRFPFGFTEHFVSDASIAGSVQDPWPADERPSDCLTAEELLQRLQEGREIL